MLATLQRLLRVSAGVFALSACEPAKVSIGVSEALSQADAAYAREDYSEAVRLYGLAAELGDASAQFKLGELYDAGERIPYNPAEALRLYRLAADQGNAEAQFSLGAMYDDGRGGLAENEEEAVRWYLLAAEQGYAKAQTYLGIMYQYGKGVPQHYGLAVRWYRAAADQRFAQAQFDLGFVYRDGFGVPQNYVEACKWWSLAAAQGYPNAAQLRDESSVSLTSPQIAECQMLAADWRPEVANFPVDPEASVRKPPEATDVAGTGSGFFITAAGHVLTNAHVVDGCTRLSLAEGSTLTVLDINLGVDLALLKKGVTSATMPLVLRQGSGVRLADSIVVAGYPLAGLLSSGLNVTTGTVSALAGPGDDHRLIQITAPVQPGNSGGPLLDTSGNVVGVVVSKLDAVKVASITGDIPQNVNFAISLGTLQAFLDANSIDYQTRASSSPKSNADVAELARAATVQIECRN